MFSFLHDACIASPNKATLLGTIIGEVESISDTVYKEKTCLPLEDDTHKVILPPFSTPSDDAMPLSFRERKETEA